MPNMETENSNVSRAEEIKVLANDAFKGTSTLFPPVSFFRILYYYSILLIQVSVVWLQPTNMDRQLICTRKLSN